MKVAKAPVINYLRCLFSASSGPKDSHPPRSTRKADKSSPAASQTASFDDDDGDDEDYVVVGDDDVGCPRKTEEAKPSFLCCEGVAVFEIA